MSMGSEAAREDAVESFCKKVAEKIKNQQDPKIKKALKELGTEILSEYLEDPVIKILKQKPKWVKEYLDIFR